MNLKKQLKFMAIADAYKAFSKDQSTQVGAVALDDRMNVVSSGWNGFPRGVNDNVEARHKRPEKYEWTAHAEENLVAQAAYTGACLRGTTVLVTSLYPCSTCARLLSQAGVIRVVAPKMGNERWIDKNLIAKTIFEEAGVEVIEIDS